MKCPCGSAADYQDCCWLLHQGDAKASNAEQLMRSRYSAFVMKEYQYLIDTHHPDTRGDMSLLTLANSNKDTKWLGLQILSTTDRTVSFRAYFQSTDAKQQTSVLDSSRQDAKIHCLHENSRFSLEESRWYYLDGEHNTKLAVLPARKDPCFCGSGKKFKNCHEI